MHILHLSHDQITDYLLELEKAKLLDSILGSAYVTTAKGQEYLEKYKELQEIVYLPTS